MALTATLWRAKMWGNGSIVTLPFDGEFKPNNDRIALSRVGQNPFWHITVGYPNLGDNPREHPDAPYFVQLYDNDDFVPFEFDYIYSNYAGLSHGYGPVPTTVGKRHVRLVVLNRDRVQLLAQSGDYYVEPG